MRWAGHVARMGGDRGVYRVLVGKPEGKRPLGRPRRRWVDNIRLDLQEVGCEYMDWIGLAQDRDRWRTFVSAVMNLWVPWNAENFLTSCKPVSCSRRILDHGVSKYSKEQNKIGLLVGFWLNQAVRVVLSVVPNWVGVSILFYLRTGSDRLPRNRMFCFKNGTVEEIQKVVRSGSYLWLLLAVTIAWDLLKLFFQWKYSWNRL